MDKDILKSLSKPVIKWSGSKRSQAELILAHFPNEIDTYYEPFVGGGSMLAKLMCSDIKVNNFICSDINEDLINLWNVVERYPKFLIKVYRQFYEELIALDCWEKKGRYYNYLRNVFNSMKYDGENYLHKVSLFLFLNRTCFNGMTRYNDKGQFNTSFHINRNGINPDTLENIINGWSELLNEKNVQFKCQDFTNITPNPNDYVYLDPPYANTKGMYGSSDGVLDFNNERLFKFLSGLQCKWCMSYDGKGGEDDNTFAVPDELYDLHVYLESGNSSFKRLKTDKKTDKVLESLYIKI